MTHKKVPAAELEVLACLKHLGQATAREIRETMHPYRPMAHGSVVNLLKRLQAKALVTKKRGRSARPSFTPRPRPPGPFTGM